MQGYEFLLLALLVLACPISMWFMMRGHRGHRDHGGETSDAHRRMRHDRPRDTGAH